jgi:hypothetical protein
MGLVTVRYSSRRAFIAFSNPAIAGVLSEANTAAYILVFWASSVATSAAQRSPWSFRMTVKTCALRISASARGPAKNVPEKVTVLTEWGALDQREVIETTKQNVPTQFPETTTHKTRLRSPPCENGYFSPYRLRLCNHSELFGTVHKWSLCGLRRRYPCRLASLSPGWTPGRVREVTMMP